MSLLKGLGLAFGAIATATLLTILVFRFQILAFARLAPFFFLVAVMACSWVGGYAAGIPSVLFATGISVIFARRTFDPSQDLYRVALLTLVSGAVSWIASHRRHVEAELRAGVLQKTSELQSAVGHLEREVQERKAAEEEIRRLNQLLERRVDERTRQLEASNQELESFSYSVSHDLRAPLRSIDGFSRILLGNCFNKFDEEERALFQRILSATGRMNELIDDLLNMARVTRTPMHTERVDLSALAEKIGTDLLKEHPDSQAQFAIQPGLVASGDSSLIEVVLRNLLENAWKFSSLTPHPRVEFGASAAGEEPRALDDPALESPQNGTDHRALEAAATARQVLFVRDNGAGFDPAYKSKLFSPFQRLHRQDEFPGTGIGLATVSRIIHRHGGWISADSQPGKGATFFFTLNGWPVTPSVSPALYLPEDPNPPAPRSEVPSSSSTQSTPT